jgi:hypothetical protein
LPESRQRRGPARRYATPIFWPEVAVWFRSLDRLQESQTAGGPLTTERKTDMARAKVNRGLDSEMAQQVISMAIGAAEVL